MERRLGADLRLAIHLKETYQKDENKHSSKACCDLTRDNGFKVKEDELR